MPTETKSKCSALRISCNPWRVETRLTNRSCRAGLDPPYGFARIETMMVQRVRTYIPR